MTSCRVPNTPGKTLLAGVLAATMDPLGAAIAVAGEAQWPTGSVALGMFFPNYLAAVLSVLPAHLISRLGWEITRARELGSYWLGDLLARGVKAGPRVGKELGRLEDWWIASDFMEDRDGLLSRLNLEDP